MAPWSRSAQGTHEGSQELSCGGSLDGRWGDASWLVEMVPGSELGWAPGSRSVKWWECAWDSD